MAPAGSRTHELQQRRKIATVGCAQAVDVVLPGAPGVDQAGPSPGKPWAVQSVQQAISGQARMAAVAVWKRID